MGLKRIMPTVNHILVSADVYGATSAAPDGVVDSSSVEGALKPVQTVLAVGPGVRQIEVGQRVMLNPQRYTRPVHMRDPNSVMADDFASTVTEFPTVDVDGRTCIYVYDTDVDMIVLEED